MRSAAAYHLASWLGTEVRLGENLLQAEHLHALAAGFLDQRQMGGDHAVPDLGR